MSQVAAIQMISGADVQANLRTAARLIADAAAAGAQLVLLPECFAAFGNRTLADIAAAEYEGSGPIRPFLAEQARQHGIWLVAGSIPLPAEP
ncbi:MAG: nitrilase-related carbon-nitrogen hydrolase, partial [Pseudomonas sp.]